MREVVTAGRVLLDRADIQQVLRHMADEIVAMEWPADARIPAAQRPKPWLVGIHRGGVQVARELADVIALGEGWRPEIGVLDPTLYRDDTWLKGPHAVEAETRLPGDVAGQRVVLVDDVLYTGRTVRAALSVLLDFGRPEAVRLAVLVDRGGRELPVQADVVGHRAQAQPGESFELRYADSGRMAQVVVEPKA